MILNLILNLSFNFVILTFFYKIYKKRNIYLITNKSINIYFNNYLENNKRDLYLVMAFYLNKKPIYI